ncbi:MAG: bifunctional diaminohydroxyphosphoribosylaminopyrimidine deaminase/5-amino-6-(5-phosphoribosylamino)uracil reductase RibD [Bacteroidetes bacterium]|nr:bifunctional diaminohydroxyphosphoribosylaminopyrimidine deaminase/5-amino-6-(5-phosphoribosylamino)uracil reductase RibD [Bacteroidota bacterium]MDA0907425.1 bifunctional diaminohydroxyphosphoribosylaminopyrimidine deaminase/5-amino-6-(5-phosphoribosylamino)uracil reductase RibD [Bacteroidota bacterium]
MTTTSSSDRSVDTQWMTRALRLAEQGRGFVSPNPLVGCVILDQEGEVIGEGAHLRFGDSHAEANALASVQDQASLQGATAYVTLEPCTHHGKTPPCATALAQSGIGRVVIALQDPNTHVSGGGAAWLQSQGIEVEIGVCRIEAEEQNRAFLHWIETGLPYVQLKWAQTLDGFSADHEGNSQWISGKESRQLVHQWRSEVDAVLVGSATVLADNPRLTVRHVEGRQPRRVILDSKGTLPPTAQVFQDEFSDKTIWITAKSAKSAKSNAATFDPMLELLSSHPFNGTRLTVEQDDQGHCSLRQVLRALAEQDITSVMVEAGPTLAASFLRENLVDQIDVFTAPILFGKGMKAVDPTVWGMHLVEEDGGRGRLPTRFVTTETFGQDILTTYRF